ncbi:MAG: hypothetical protein HC831_11915 [Chloroflexia bacterium]|nr:hypothetical protein [Chloroflexia bacterium]
MPLQLSKLEIPSEYIIAWENSLNLIAKLISSWDIFIVRRTEKSWKFITETDSFRSNNLNHSEIKNLLFDEVGKSSSILIAAGEENEFIRKLNTLIETKVLSFFGIPLSTPNNGFSDVYVALTVKKENFLSLKSVHLKN